MEAKTELQRNAIVDARRKELESYQRALDIQWLNSRMEDGRMGRCLALIQQEAEMEKDFQERTDHAAIVNARAEKEISLGIEIAKVRREEACKLLRRQYLRERDPSLRELSKKLHAGYVCRDLKQQILDNKYRKLQEKVEEQRANFVLRDALPNDKEAKELEEREKTERATKYCLELQQQLVGRQRERQCQYEDTLVEKKMLDDIMRTIADEDKRELAQKRELTERARREMVSFTAARESWRRKQRQLVLAEETRIEQQRRDMADRSSNLEAEREQKFRMREEVNQKIADKILIDEAARKERENIITELQQQELLEKNVQDDIAQKARLDRAGTETKHALTAQMENRKMAAAQERVKEAEFRKMAEAKMAAENEKELEKERQRKLKNREYSQQLRAQIEGNALRRKKDQEMEDARARYEWDCDNAWRKEVAVEREKIVEEHVPHVLGYLQAGVVQPQDLPAVGRGARAHDNLNSLDIESLAITSKVDRHPKCNAQCRIIREY